MTPSGIEPATFRFVAQHLNHCATAVRRFQLLTEGFQSKMQKHREVLQRPDIPIVKRNSLVTNSPLPPYPLNQCFSTFVRPRPGKFFFHKTRARS